MHPARPVVVRRPSPRPAAPRLLRFHKPYGVLSQFTPEGRWTGLLDWIDVPGVYVAGRLDADSEGLLLLTNDGQLQARIADPRHKMAKTYWAQVEGVPTEAALAALTNAALRGVDVQILVPKKSDSIFVTAAARSYFDELIRCGVRVHEYEASMLHSKTLVVDDNIAIIGTANFDYRSFFLNYEVCLIGYGSQLNAELAQQFKADLRNANTVQYKSEKRFLRRLFDSAARLTSPLL